MREASPGQAGHNPEAAIFLREVIVPFPASSLKSIKGPVFKYHKATDAAVMLERGSVRFGTLLEFRDEKRFGTHIGDAGQGTLLHYDATPFVSTHDPSTQSAVFREVVTAEASGSPYFFQGIEFQVRYSCEDCLIYCVSSSFSLELMEEFAKDGRTVCVRIDRPVPFFRRINEALRRDRSILNWAVARCDYEEREIGGGAERLLHPALLKQLDLAHEGEIRALWQLPKGTSVEAVILDCPDAAHYCVPHYTLSSPDIPPSTGYLKRAAPEGGRPIVGEGSMSKLKVVRDRVFQNREVVLDNRRFVNVTFNNCKLVFRGGGPVQMEGGIEFGPCQWVLDGPSLETIRFLTALYDQGGEGIRRLVDDLIDRIRGKK